MKRQAVVEIVVRQVDDAGRGQWCEIFEELEYHVAGKVSVGRVHAADVQQQAAIRAGCDGGGYHAPGVIPRARECNGGGSSPADHRGEPQRLPIKIKTRQRHLKRPSHRHRDIVGPQRYLHRPRRRREQDKGDNAKRCACPGLPDPGENYKAHWKRSSYHLWQTRQAFCHLKIQYCLPGRPRGSNLGHQTNSAAVSGGES